MKLLAPALLSLLPLGVIPITARAQATPTATWDSVGNALKAPGIETGGYHRYNFPRRDITLTVGEVTASPALALGTWAGFGGDPSDATAMGDLVVVTPVLNALAAHRMTATAAHTHMIGESPAVYFIHFWADGTRPDVTRGLRAALGAAR